MISPISLPPLERWLLAFGIQPVIGFEQRSGNSRNFERDDNPDWPNREEPRMNIDRFCRVIIHRLGHLPLGAAVLAVGVGVAAWFLAAPPAGALNNRQQILYGGNTVSPVDTHFTSPGFGNGKLGPDFPATGLGEQSLQLRMSGGGVLSLLWVRLTTATTPSSGSFTVTVRINGADTALTCTLFSSGQCQTGATTVNIPNGARLSLSVSNNFVGSGNMSYTYTMLLD
jgi:hypothetical protein